MDPITAAILAVLPALASDTATAVVKDSYDGLKAIIRRKWGDAAPITKAVTALEEDPESKAQAAVLGEKVAATGVAADADVAEALRKLVEAMHAAGIGGTPQARVQLNISGGVVQGVAGAENVTVSSMTFGTPPGPG
jgi:hypothetical protein